MTSVVKTYFADLSVALGAIDKSAITRAVDAIVFRQSNIYTLGNGGSAATANHLANDLLSVAPSRSLCANSAVLTMIANDYGYDFVFLRQLRPILERRDTVIAFSASGNSTNVLEAVNFAKTKGAYVVGVTGFDGGLLAKAVDVNIHVPTPQGQYGVVEDCHLAIAHALAADLRSRRIDTDG